MVAVPSPEELADGGHRHHVLAELTEAIRSYSGALEKAPHLAWVRLNRGMAHLQNGSPDEGLHDLDRALEELPQSYEAHEARVWGRIQVEDFDGALEDYAWMVKVAANPADVYAVRSSLHVSRGDLDRAMDDCMFAIELLPGSSKGYLARAHVHVERKEYDQALLDFNRVLSLNPSDAWALHHRGCLRMHQGDLQGAIGDFTKSLKHVKDLGWSFYARAVALYAEEKLDEALEDFRRARDAAKFDPVLRDYAHLRVWMTWTRLGRRIKADREWKPYLDRRPRRKSRDWFAVLAGFMSGTVPEAELMRLARHPNARTDAGQRCQAFFHIGMARLFDPQGALAAPSFEQCLAVPAPFYYEQVLARGELTMLSREEI
jgi:tetratricopeptide (TPR) repeat protein